MFKTMSSNKKAFKSAIWYTVGDIIVKGLGFLTTPLFTRILTTSDYGEYSNFVSWISILMPLITIDLTASVSRAHFDFPEDMDNFVLSSVLFSNLATVIFAVFSIFSIDYLESWLLIDRKYIFAMFIYFLLEPAYSYLQGYFRMLFRYKTFTEIALASAALRTGMALLFTVLFEDKLFACIIGYTVPVSVMYGIIYIYIVIKAQKVKMKYWRYAAKISLPLIPHTLSGNLLSSFDRVAIRKLCNAESLAYYSLAYNVAMIVSLVRAAVDKAWTPWLYENLHEKKYSQIKKVSCVYIIIFETLICGLMLLGPEFVLIFGGKLYTEAKYVIPPIMVGLIFQFLYTFYVGIELFSKKTPIISIGTLSAVGINIITNIMFIPRFGYIAAAYTTLFSYLALLVIHFCFARKMMDLSEVYDNRLIFISGLICIIVGIGMEQLYRFDYIRYTLFLIYVICFIGGSIFVWKNRKEFDVRI